MERVRVEVSAHVGFADMFGCMGPEAVALMDLCWSNPLFDCARQMLADLFPRRRFDTKFGVTVGSPRAGKGGTYFMGRRDFGGRPRAPGPHARQGPARHLLGSVLG